MLRWKYVLSRLALLILFFAVAWLATNPILRWSLIQGAQSVVGAKVQIATLRTLLTQSELRLAGVAVADPRSPLENLFEAESAVLDIDVAQLMQRRLVVKEGSLSGMRLGAARQTDGTLPGAAPIPGGPPIAEKARHLVESWLDDAAGRMRTDVEEELHTVQLGRELARRWPAEYASLEAHAKELRERGKSLVASVEETRANPLKSVEHYQKLLADLETLRADSLSLRQEFARLHQQVLADQDAAQRAKAHDAEFVKQQLRLAKLDPEAVSDYLLGPEMGPRVLGLVRWLQWGRQQLPASSTAPRPTRRGWDFVLPSMRAYPDLLIQRLLVEGTGRSDGQPFSFQGSLADVTPQPDRHGKPATMRITTRGAVAMEIEAVLDHTTGVPSDRIVVHCPRATQPARTLGSKDQLAVEVAPGPADWRIDLKLSGDALWGRMAFHQPAVQLKTQVGNGLASDFVARPVSNAAASINELQAVVELDGTLREPRWKLESNLGPKLTGGIQTALEEELKLRQQELLAKAHQEVDQQIARLEDDLQAKQTELLDKLNLNSRELEMLQAELARWNLPGRLLGQDGVLKKLFQR